MFENDISQRATDVLRSIVWQPKKLNFRQRTVAFITRRVLLWATRSLAGRHEVPTLTAQNLQAHSHNYVLRELLSEGLTPDAPALEEQGNAHETVSLALRLIALVSVIEPMSGDDCSESERLQNRRHLRIWKALKFLHRLRDLVRLYAFRGSAHRGACLHGYTEVLETWHRLYSEMPHLLCATVASRNAEAVRLLLSAGIDPSRGLYEYNGRFLSPMELALTTIDDGERLEPPDGAIAMQFLRTKKIPRSDYDYYREAVRKALANSWSDEWVERELRQCVWALEHWSKQDA